MLLALALLLSGCGRADQRAEQPSPAPLSPAPSTPEVTTPTPAARATPVLIRPTPDETQLAASVTVAFIETSIAASDNEYNTTATAKAEWAQTPEPTLLPPADGPRLRDLWPAVAQQVAPPTRLYLRSFSHKLFAPDLFWEVNLPDAQIRRLPTVEQDSGDQSAHISPDGRFLAYVTGNAKTMERTLRVLDLVQETDRVFVKFVSAGFPGCRQSFAWSPDGHSLAAITLHETDSLFLLQLYDNAAGDQAPQTLVELPDPELRLLGWLDTNHLLFWHWKSSMRFAQLVSIDRQGNSTPVAELPLESLSCTILSPDGQNLIYNEHHQVKRLHLRTGQQSILALTPKTVYEGRPGLFPATPKELFWVGDGDTLLFSRLGTDRRVWLGSLDQLQKQFQEQSAIFLSPPYQAAYKFGIIGVSPDNRTLVACEQAPTDNPRIRVRGSQTWVYSIPDDRWTLIRTNPEGICDLVLGWGNDGGAR